MIAAHEPGPRRRRDDHRARSRPRSARALGVRAPSRAARTRHCCRTCCSDSARTFPQSGFWDEVAAGESGSHDPRGSLEGQRLGPYRIVRKLGSGGMGDVYLAERADEEYQQQVAIKLVRSGVFSRQVQGRLRMERQILATLQHPNIARLLDGGRAPDGTPYLVMEYIDGEPIDAYCDRRRLAPEERIALVRTVCAAVQYAHQNLIVHRDLKPNNILITPQGVPKLLDFGIAKLLDTRQSAHDARGHARRVPRHDAGAREPGAGARRRDHHRQRHLRARRAAVRAVVRAAAVPAARREPAGDGAHHLRAGSADAERDGRAHRARIARAADRHRRVPFDDAGAAAEIPARRRRQHRRHGDAQGSRAALQLRRAARRGPGAPSRAASRCSPRRTPGCIARASSSAGTSSRSPPRLLAIVTLAAFATITFVQAQRIAYERDVATTERTRAEQVSSFLVELFELSDPSRSRGNQVTARELLDIGARRVSLGLADQPETRATLLGTIGTVYQSLGLYSDSVALLEEGLKSRIAHSRAAAPGRRGSVARARRCVVRSRRSRAMRSAADRSARHAARAARSGLARDRADADCAGEARAAARRLSTRRSGCTTRAWRSTARTARSARPTRPR